MLRPTLTKWLIINAIPLVAVSAGAMRADIERARDAGMDDYICKPFNIAEMFTLLDQSGRWNL